MLLIVKAKVAIKSVVLVAPVAFALGGAGVAPPPLVPVTTVSVAAGSFQYLGAGWRFRLEGRPVNAPRHDYRCGSEPDLHEDPGERGGICRRWPTKLANAGSARSWAGGLPSLA